MSKISLIIRREYNERVRKRSFLITTLLTPLLMVGLMVGAGWMMARGSSEHKVIEVLDASGVVAPRLENAGTIEFRPSARTLEEVQTDRGETWGALVVGADVVANPDDVKLYSWSSSTMETESAIARAVEDAIEAEKLRSYDIENLPQIMEDVRTTVHLSAYTVDEASGAEKESSSALSMGLAYVFGFVMYMFVLIYGAQVMQGVIEEKNSKVLEVVASSVRPFELMMGKIVGIACVALTQFALWAVVLVAGGMVAMHAFVPEDVMAAAQSMQGMTPGAMTEGVAAAMDASNAKAVAMVSSLMDVGYIARMLAVFLFYFVGGYLVYAAAFAAVGSAVENIQDAQQFQTPITLPIIFGLIGMISAMNDPNGALAFWLSIIPFTSPMVMVARIPYGVPGWELALSVVLLVATFVAMVWIAGKIYRVGIFMYGKKPNIKDLAKWITYK